MSFGVGEQPVPQLHGVFELALGAAVADRAQPVGAEHPVDPVHAVTGEHRPVHEAAIRCSIRRAARPPVSMLIESSW